ncbi:phage tail tape measure protein [Streptomyces sp. NPDC126499]|uniref:phage tail tape measure protein n=1 Tax=Streptomyces sp. NPDC126499 TaxID=3155314 RepID=UPI0033312DAE
MLTADIGAFRARMAEAARNTDRAARSMRDSMRDSARTMARIGENQTRTLRAVQGGSLALVAAFGFAVAAAARFEKAMSNVKAVSQASAGEMATLRAAALQAGRTTAFSAVQAADAMHELAKAGVSTADITGGALTGALNLAAAAEVDVAEGAEIAANAMTVFGLSGKDMSHVADLLAAAANKSTTDVHQMGMSLRMAGQVASQTGLSIEDTVGALTLFAAEGLKGSDAGTSFKVMLQRLTPQSKEAQATMDKLGLSAYDAQGNFVGLQEFAGRMQTAFKNLTPEARNAAMGVIFGSDAVRAANILYKYGEQGIRRYTDAVNDQGYAAAVAQTRMDNLIGDLKLLRSALETALIQTGTAANSALRDMVQWITRLVNIYNQLPPGLQEATGLLTGLVGVIGLVGASMLLLLPRILLVRRELLALGITAQVVRTQLMTLGRLGLVLGTLTAIGWGINKIAEQFREAPPNVTKMTNALVDFAQRGKVAGELARNFGADLDGFGEAVARIAHPGVLDRVEDFFGTFDPGTEHGGPGLDAAVEKLQAIDEAMASLVKSGNAQLAAENFQRLAAEAEASGTSADKLRTLLPQYAEALTNADTQAKLAADSQGSLGDATAMTADEMADQRTEAEKLQDALNALNGAAISAAEGEISFRESLAELSTAVEENGHSLDVTTEKGRAVKTAFLDAAKAAMEHAQAVSEQMGSQEAGNAVLAKNIGLLRQAMAQADFTTEQIDELTGAYAQLPVSAETDVAAPGAADAIRQINDLYDAVANLQPGKTVVIKAPTGEAVRALQAAGYAVKSIPGSKDVRVTAPTNAAQSSVAALRRALDNLRDRQVTVTTVHRTVQNNTVGRPQRGEGGISKHAGGGRINRYSTGGMVLGAGSSTSDSVPAMLSAGEYVIRAAAVRKYGPGFLDGLNTMRAPGTLSGRHFTSGAPGGTGPIHVDVAARVFIGDREVRDIVRVEVQPMIRESEKAQAYRAKVGRAL